MWHAILDTRNLVDAPKYSIDPGRSPAYWQGHELKAR